MTKRRRSVGRIRTRLAELLAAFGIAIEPEDLHTQEDAYRSPKWDLARWMGDGKWTGNPTNLPACRGEITVGMKVYVYSWDTMTNCVREGIVLSPDNTGVAMGWRATEVHRAG